MQLREIPMANWAGLPTNKSLRSRVIRMAKDRSVKLDRFSAVFLFRDDTRVLIQASYASADRDLIVFKWTADRDVMITGIVILDDEHYVLHCYAVECPLREQDIYKFRYEIHPFGDCAIDPGIKANRW